MDFYFWYGHPIAVHVLDILILFVFLSLSLFLYQYIENKNVFRINFDCVEFINELR